MDSNAVVAIALLCFFFFFFFFFLLGGVGFYFFIVKKKDTSEEKTRSMTWGPRPPYVHSFLTEPKPEPDPFDISEDKIFKDSKERLVRLEDIVSGLQKEKELRDMKALEEKKSLEEKERIETEAKRLLDNLEKAEAYSVNSMEKRMISLSGPIEDAVLQKLYELDNLIHYKSSSDLVGKRMEIFYFLEKSSLPNKENTKDTEDTELTPEMKYQYNVNKKLHGDL